jgi:hypothetical protein
MIWWIGAGFLYLIIMAAICVFFKGASMYDRSMEEYEGQLLSTLDNKKPSEFPEHASLQITDAVPSAY